MTARQNWSDDRVDRLALKIDRRFDRLEDKVDKGFETVDQRVDDRFQELRNELNQRLGAVDERFHFFQRTMVVLHGGIIAGLIGVIATQL